VTISLEQLADGSVSDRNFQKLMSLVIDTGGQSVGIIRFGTTNGGAVNFGAGFASRGRRPSPSWTFTNGCRQVVLCVVRQLITAARRVVF
jgi:hypothetical protein